MGGINPDNDKCYEVNKKTAMTEQHGGGGGRQRHLELWNPRRDFSEGTSELRHEVEPVQAEEKSISGAARRFLFWELIYTSQGRKNIRSNRKRGRNTRKSPGGRRG